MKITIGKFDIESLPHGIFYEHQIHGDEKSGIITVLKNKFIMDLSGDTDIPLSVLSALLANNLISLDSFKEQMIHRYSMTE